MMKEEEEDCLHATDWPSLFIIAPDNEQAGAGAWLRKTNIGHSHSQSHKSHNRYVCVCLSVFLISDPSSNCVAGLRKIDSKIGKPTIQ